MPTDYVSQLNSITQTDSYGVVLFLSISAPSVFRHSFPLTSVHIS